MSGPRTTTDRSRLGFTLIELTVVLAVIVTLALVLTPSIANFINDSRSARATSDCNTIGGAIANFYRDNGFYPMWKVALNGGPGTAQNRVQLLVSPGNIPAEEQLSTWTSGTTALLSEQLVNNTPGYTFKSTTSPLGWNGPYLSSEIIADPWGNRYVVNVELLDPGATVVGVGGKVKAAVWVLSAGPNGVIETRFNQSILTAARGGDDIVFRIQ